jgi:predicted phosphodiesterase
MKTLGRFRRALSAVVPALLLLLAACTAGTGPVGPPGPTPLPRSQVSLTRGPYLQDMTASAVTIAWRTGATTQGGVAIRPAAGAAAAFAIHPEPASTADHVLRVSGLQPATAYRYAVLAADGELGAEAEFRTAPAPGAPTPFTFAIWGDSGCGCPQQTAVAAQIARSGADLLLHTGDVIYERGEATLYDPRFFAPYQAVLASAPVYPVLGNHDVATDNGAPWLHAFFLPGDNGKHTTRYYAFNYGNAHFIALDSEEPYGPTSAQYGWLLRDLQSPAAQGATWRFAFFHRPPYSSGLGHGSTYDLRETWGPLFERLGVDLVFSGHEHNYERSTPRRDYASVGGTHAVIYIVTGGGGSQTYNVGRQPWSAFAAMVYHYVRVRLDGPRLALQAIGTDGQVIDHLELTH